MCLDNHTNFLDYVIETSKFVEPPECRKVSQYDETSLMLEEKLKLSL